MPARSPAELAVQRRQFRGMRAAAVTAAVLLFIALILYAVGLVAGLEAECGAGDRIAQGNDPGAAAVDKNLSYWPPGQNCDYARGADKVVQPLGWIKASIIGVAALAGVMLLLGLFSAVRYRRRRGDDDLESRAPDRT